MALSLINMYQDFIVTYIIYILPRNSMRKNRFCFGKSLWFFENYVIFINEINTTINSLLKIL